MKILLADDEEGILLVYSEMLAGNGHKVSAASNGAEVIRLLADTDFDMFILDLFMPEMDGFEAIQTLRDKGYTVPVIVMTGHFPDDEVAGRLDGLGVFTTLRKPVMISTLLNAVIEATK